MPITEHQRAMRQKHLGSSDAPRIVCVSPWGGPSDVYYEKVMPLADDSPSEAMETGNRLEPAILDWAADELGAKLKRNQFRVAADKILAANLDALVVGKRQAVEAKYVGPNSIEQWGEPGTDQVPTYVVAQVQHQMYVADLELVWIPAFVARFRPCWEMYSVERDDEIIAGMVAAELAFWNDHVLPNVPPDAQATPPIELLRRLKREPDTIVELPEVAMQAIDWYEVCVANSTASKVEKESASAALVHLLGNAEAGIAPDGRVVTYKQQTRREHVVKASTFPVLRVKNTKGDSR